jgi:tetratricopeptide (TPR) repeat protein
MAAQNPPAGTSTLKLIPVGRADWLRLVSGTILAAGAIAVYSRTFSVPLLFDDNSAIVGNSTIRHWSTAFWPPSNSTASGRPILNLSLAINYAISGTAVWSYHAANLAIHVLAGLTLFGIVRRTLAPRAGPAASLIAFSAALLWTLHPLQAESVTYIVQRAESLMGLCYLLTVYGFIRGAEADGRPRRRWFALSVAACLLGMATKEVMVSAPLIVLLYDRTFVGGSFREAWRRRWKLYVALAATWLPLAGLVASAGWDRNGTSGFGVGITPWAYWLTQFEAVTRYLWLSVWPHPLVFEYGTFRVNRLTEVAWYALVIVMLAVAVLVALWRRPTMGFLGAWFFVILAPTSVMPGRIQMIVEHRMYLPLAAVITLAAMGIHAAVRRHGWMVFAALALGLGMLTARRNEDYRSELTIWSDTVAKRPNNARAHNSLGVAWSKVPGRLQDAIAQYETALRLQPEDAEAHNNLGVAWSHLPGRRNDAAAQYEAALRLQPDYAEAHNNLGLAWSRMPGRLHDAIAQYEAALRLQPDYAVAHNNLGLAWSQIPGRLHDAAAQFEEAVRLQPDYAGAHNNLGLAWSQMPGRLHDAIAQYEAALRLQPDSAEAHYNLGNAWSQMPGRLNDTIAQYKEALRLQPDLAPAWHNLGTVWFHFGNLPAAAAAFREELRLSPNDPAARQALAAALQSTQDH